MMLALKGRVVARAGEANLLQAAREMHADHAMSAGCRRFLLHARNGEARGLVIGIREYGDLAILVGGGVCPADMVHGAAADQTDRPVSVSAKQGCLVGREIAGECGMFGVG